MITRDLHVHTCFSDGKNTPEEVVLEAIRLGMDTIGLSDHSWTEQDPCCMKKDRYSEYREELGRLKRKYAGQIRVLCGIEQDLESDIPAEGFDYVIGSVHLLRRGENWITVDWKPEILETAVKELCNGDPYALCEDYFARAAALAGTNADIIGHFDLIGKFSEKSPWFDPEHPRYVNAWKKAAEALLASGKTFEINTGAISRGWRTSPYPRDDIFTYLRQRGARFILSSDSHSRDTLGYLFDRYEPMLNKEDLLGPCFRL